MHMVTIGACVGKVTGIITAQDLSTNDRDIIMHKGEIPFLGKNVGIVPSHFFNLHQDQGSRLELPT